MTLQHLSATLQKKGIAPMNAVVYGSTPIAMYFDNFREPHDIDVVVSFPTFVSLFFKKGWHLVLPAHRRAWREIHLRCDECEAFFCWKLGTRFVPYSTLCKESVCIQGTRFADLAWVKRYKRNLAREKDLRDLGFLRLHNG